MQTGKSTKIIIDKNTTVYKSDHYKFYFLTIIDKKNNFEFNYPIGYEDLPFTGGPEPISGVRRYDKLTKEFWYVITEVKKDTFCFLDYCFRNNGKLVDFNSDDKRIFQLADSISKANYPFYKMDIKSFIKWYIPDKQY